MLDIFFAMVAAGLNGSAAPKTGHQTVEPVDPPAAVAAPQTSTDGTATGSVVAGQGTTLARFNMEVVPPGLVAEPQTPSGRFTTAAEVRPILEATRGDWVVVREYQGKDYLYVTHVWSWRCGLKAMAISVNGETMQNWPMPPCHEEFKTPNALIEGDAMPVLTFRPGSVQTITIQVVFDDLGMDVAEFERANILIP